MTDAKEQAGSEPSGPRPVETSEATGSEFGSGPKPSSFADTQPGTDYRGTAIPTGALLAGRYRIDHFIARGGMGEVYAAQDIVLNDRVALKTVTGTSSGDMGSLAALRAEVTLSRKISHPNVCRMHDIGVHVSQVAPQLTFLTMEYIDGESLGARVGRDGAIAEGEAARLLAAILAGLQAAHEAGVLHRDLKSDNVMLRLRPNAEPMPVIMDFGLASALSPNSSRVSSEQAMVGSLAYMAPEQVQGDALRVATDIYSVGVIFFEMLTGQLPFKASSPALAALKRLHEPAPRVRSIDPRISVTLDRILAKALQHRPQDRYQSARAMLKDVLDYLARGDEADVSERAVANDVVVSSEPVPSTESAPPPEFGADETTLVTGRSPSAPGAAGSRPPASIDNSLPVLAAATARPVGPQRSRRVWGWVAVGGAAAGLVLLGVVMPLGKRSEPSAGSPAPMTIGIGPQETPAAEPGVTVRPAVNGAVSQHAPTEVVGVGASDPAAALPSAVSSGAESPAGATSAPATLAAQKRLVNSKGSALLRPAPPPTPGALAVGPVATDPGPAHPQPSLSVNTAGLVYPPGVKKPVLLPPADAPSVQ